MKRFKQFLIEEIAVADAGQEQVAPDTAATAYPNYPQYTPTTTPKKKLTKASLNKQAKAGTETEEDDNQKGYQKEEKWPSWEEWYSEHPMPERKDYGSDEDYEKAWDDWVEQYLKWLIGMGDPGLWDFDAPYGQWKTTMDEYYRRLDKARGWGDADKHGTGDLPPGWTKEDYDFWWNLWKKNTNLGGGVESKNFYDWLWRLFRHGKPGFEGVEAPWEGEFPIGVPKELKDNQ